MCSDDLQMNSDHFLRDGELEIQKEGGFVSTSYNLPCLTNYVIDIHNTKRGFFYVSIVSAQRWKELYHFSYQNSRHLKYIYICIYINLSVSHIISGNLHFALPP